MTTNKRAWNRISVAKETEICQRYVDGELLKSITEAVGMQKAAVCTVLRRNNLPKRGYKSNKTSFTERHTSYALEDEIGKVYQALTVVCRTDNDAFDNARWICKCVCGKEVVRHGNYLRSRKNNSCGCQALFRRRTGTIIYKRILAMARNVSRKNKLPFDLDIDFVRKTVHENCTYCGREPYVTKYAYHKTRYSEGIETDEGIKVHGLDKIIPELGYTKANSVSCCKYCNRAKSDLSLTSFKDLVTLIYKHYVDV